MKEDGAEPLLVVPRAPLPAGATNYVTRRGLAALHDERALVEALRPIADDANGAAALAAHNARLGALEARIASAVAVDAATLPHDEVRFSAAVTLRSATGHERQYRLVGVDEADAQSGRIAFVAPLARELTGKRVGDVVTLRQHGAETEYEIVVIDYSQE